MGRFSFAAQLFVFVLITPVVFSQTKVNSCKGHSSPIEVHFNDCTKPPCDTVRNTNGTTEIVFRATSNSTKFYSKVRGTWFGIGVDHKLGDHGTDACKYLTKGTCPLQKGEEYVYKMVDFVKPDEIKVNDVTLMYKIMSERGKVMTCFTLTTNVVDRKGEAQDSEENDDDHFK